MRPLFIFTETATHSREDEEKAMSVFLGAAITKEGRNEMRVKKIANDYYVLRIHKSEVRFEGDYAYVSMNLHDVSEMGRNCAVEAMAGAEAALESSEDPSPFTGLSEGKTGQSQIDAEIGEYEYKREMEL